MHCFSFFVFIGFNEHLGAKCDVCSQMKHIRGSFWDTDFWCIPDLCMAKALSHCRAILRYMSIVATFEAQYTPSLVCVFCVPSLLEWFSAKWGILLGPQFPTSLAFYFVLI